METPGEGCPGCGAARVEGPECPRCGIIYAKARRAPAGPLELALPPEEPYAVAPVAPRVWEGEREDAGFELRFRIFAVPVALGVAVLFAQSGFGHFLMRTFLSMWIHEAGHAVAAWLCGIPAVPGPWKTLSAQSRSLLFGLLVTAGLAALGYRAWRTEQKAWLPVLGAVFALQLYCSLLLRHPDAQTLITFCGDAGCMVLGTALICTFYVRKESAIRVGWLRWGFLVIGAAALVDAGNTWWAARTDVDVIPFGEQEGVGLSDPSRLTEWSHWSVTQLVHRYVAVLVVCLLALALVYTWGLRQARRELKAVDAT